MAIKVLSCQIKGISPILMNKFPMITIEGLNKKSLEEQAEYKTYRTPTGELYIPGTNIRSCLIAAATYSKGKGRASLQKPVAACVMVDPEYCVLGTDNYEIDIRPVVNPTTKGRMLCARPRLDEWSVKFTISYDDTLLNEKDLRNIVDDAGSRVGLLDFRPDKKGSFGRFMVIKWG